MLHLLLELAQGERHVDLPLPDAGEEDGDAAAGGAGALPEAEDEVVVLDLVPEQLQLRPKDDILAPHSYNIEVQTSTYTIFSRINNFGEIFPTRNDNI